MRRTEMRRLITACFTLLLLVTILLGRTMFTSMAKEEERSAVSYYKSIQIKEGDNLWNIAARYKDGGHMSTGEYITELKAMNNLKEDTIHAGQYLTVVYFK
ncbi:MAG: LysM peptidoglycan-binding domain-containing protein [Enterocloster sp.]